MVRAEMAMLKAAEPLLFLSGFVPIYPDLNRRQRIWKWYCQIIGRQNPYPPKLPPLPGKKGDTIKFRRGLELSTPTKDLME